MLFLSPSRLYRSLQPIKLLNRLYSSQKSASSNKWLNRAKKDRYSKAARFEDYKSRAAYKLIQLNDKFNILKPGQAVVDLGFAPGAWTQVAVDKTKPKGRVLGIDIIPAVPPKGASAMQANILSLKTHKMIRNFFLEIHPTANDPESIQDLTAVPSYIESEFNEKSDEDDLDNIPVITLPIDVVLSDMYEPIIPPTRFWNNTTNSGYDRMANTSGLIVKDHIASINLCDAALILAIDLLKPDGSFICKFYTGKEDIGLEKRLKKVFKKVIRDKPDASRPESKECYFIGLQKKKNVDKIDVFS